MSERGCRSILTGAPGKLSPLKPGGPIRPCAPRSPYKPKTCYINLLFMGGWVWCKPESNRPLVRLIPPPVHPQVLKHQLCLVPPDQEKEKTTADQMHACMSLQWIYEPRKLTLGPGKPLPGEPWLPGGPCPPGAPWRTRKRRQQSCSLQNSKVFLHL